MSVICASIAGFCSVQTLNIAKKEIIPFYAIWIDSVFQFNLNIHKFVTAQMGDKLEIQSSGSSNRIL